jgi:hypothetical protein
VACRVENPDDLEWPINRCELQAGVLDNDKAQLNIWTNTPNFSHFEYRFDPAGKWSPMELSAAPGDPQEVPRWVWDLRAGKSLEARSVNRCGVGGVVARLSIDTGITAPLKDSRAMISA